MASFMTPFAPAASETGVPDCLVPKQSPRRPQRGRSSIDVKEGGSDKPNQKGENSGCGTEEQGQPSGQNGTRRNPTRNAPQQAADKHSQASRNPETGKEVARHLSEVIAVVPWVVHPHEDGGDALGHDGKRKEQRTEQPKPFSVACPGCLRGLRHCFLPWRRVFPDGAASRRDIVQRMCMVPPYYGNARRMASFMRHRPRRKGGRGKGKFVPGARIRSRATWRCCGRKSSRCRRSRLRGRRHRRRRTFPDGRRPVCGRLPSDAPGRVAWSWPP